MTFKPTSGLTSSGLNRLVGREVQAKTLSTQDRKNLPPEAFVFPDRAPGPGSYPIPDLPHARDALSRSANTSDAGAVRRAVLQKFPQLRNK